MNIKLLNMEGIRKLSYIISYVFVIIINFAALYIFTRLLTISEFGLYSLYISFVPILSSLIGISSYRLIPFVRVYTKSNNDYNLFLSSVLLLSFINAIIAFIILFTYWDITLSVLFVIIILSLSQALGNFFRSLFDYDKKIKISSLIPILESFTALVFSIVLVYILSTNKVLGRLLGIGISAFLTCFIYLKFMNLNIKFDVKWIKFVFIKGFSLIPHTLGGQLLIFADRFIIAMFCSNATVALYSAPYVFSNVVNAINVTLNRHYLPLITNDFSKEDFKNFSAQIIQFSFDMLRLSISLILIAPFVFYLLIPSEYWSGFIVFYPVAISMYIVFIYSLSFHIEILYGVTRFSMVSTLFTAVLNIILNYLLIPSFGYYIAALTTLISYIVLLILHMFYVYFSLQFRHLPIINLMWHLSILVGVAIFSAWLECSQDTRLFGFILGSICGIITLLQWIKGGTHFSKRINN